MIKFFSRFFLITSFIILIFIIFLSYAGIETGKFDKLIKTKSNNVNKHVKLEFNKTKIYLNLKELNIFIKLQKPKILAKNNEIKLSKLNLYLPIKSFFTSDYLIKKANVAFEENDIKDLTKITNIFLPKIINIQLKKIFEKGSLEGEFIISFKSDGSIAKEYGFTGKMSDALINITKEFSIKNLTTEISYTKNINAGLYSVFFQSGSLLNQDLSGSLINLERKKDQIKIKSDISTNGKLNFEQIKKISSLLNLNTNSFKDINGKANLITSVFFDLNNQFKIKNLSYKTKGKISYLEIQSGQNKTIKNYLPKYDSKIIFKDTDIIFNNSKSGHITKLNGLIKIDEHFDSFDLSEKYNLKKKSSAIKGKISLTNSEIKISKLNYFKDSGSDATLAFDVILGKFYNINALVYHESLTEIILANVKLNKNFEITDFKQANAKTFVDASINNDFSLTKNNEIIITGKIFDAEPLLKSLYKNEGKKTFDKNFTSKIKINFEKILTGTNDDVFKFAMISSIRNGSYEKLSLKGDFSHDEIIEMSIYQIDNEKKTLQVISDRARPFIKNFNFIKGFEGGKLQYESIISKESSKSNLKITDFRVSKVPSLAKLLTLASLQGIADTLSGEGIRFESFEMKSNTKGNTMNIEDALAIGPAVSILLEGYVDKGNLVSLRGTLVPATKLNSIIASIPVVGDILVGSKTGEGVVGVSFKMKGPPKNIKTTVNPIKTLTPRFIVRMVETMKRKKNEGAK